MSVNSLWLLVCAAALVLLMTPGVAFFYGGLVKAKSVVSMMMMSFGALGLVSVLWILYGDNMSVVDSVSGVRRQPVLGLRPPVADVVEGHLISRAPRSARPSRSSPSR